MKLTVQGHEAYAYTGGKPFNPALPCVVFIHGALHDHSVWNLLARWCAHHGWSVLAVDQPGHGRSGGPLLPSVEAIADWCLALLDAARVRQAAWVGHSMGSLIALAAAGRAPERASHLVLMGSAYPMKVSDALLTMARDTPEAGMNLVNSLSISSQASKPSYPGPGFWLHGGNRRLMSRIMASQPGSQVFSHDFDLCNRYDGGLQAAAAVRCKSHVISGQADQMTPPKAMKALAQALNARQTLLPCGHGLMHECPELTLAALREALA